MIYAVKIGDKWWAGNGKTTDLLKDARRYATFGAARIAKERIKMFHEVGDMTIEEVKEDQ